MIYCSECGSKVRSTYVTDTGRSDDVVGVYYCDECKQLFKYDDSRFFYSLEILDMMDFGQIEMSETDRMRLDNHKEYAEWERKE